MAKVTVTEAARLAGLGRQQLYRGYISTGKISVERNHQGKPQIDTAEILRVFGELKETPEATHGESHVHDVNSVVQAKDEVIRELRERLREAGDREAWLRQQLERAQAVLTDQGARDKRRWWQFWGN